MSWHILKAGRAAAVAAAIAREGEACARQSHNSDQAKKAIRASVETITSVLEGMNPDTMVVARTSGHFDSNGGNAEVKIETVPSAELPEADWVTRALEPPVPE